MTAWHAWAHCWALNNLTETVKWNRWFNSLPPGSRRVRMLRAYRGHALHVSASTGSHSNKNKFSYVTCKTQARITAQDKTVKYQRNKRKLNWTVTTDFSDCLDQSSIINTHYLLLSWSSLLANHLKQQTRNGAEIMNCLIKLRTVFWLCSVPTVDNKRSQPATCIKTTC